VKFRSSYVAGLVALVLAWLFSHGRSTPYNNYVLLADALLHGHLWINWPGPYIDAVAFNGHRYIVNDPLPALFMLPAVAVWGTAANQTLLGVVLCGVAVGAAWELCQRLGCNLDTTAWLCAFMLAGTPLLWCSMLGDVWFLAETSCVAMMLLALCETAGKNRTWLVLLLYAGAIASRFTVVMALPVVMLLSLGGGLQAASLSFERGTSLLRRLAGAAVVVVLCIALWVTYNMSRWGVPWDSGHTIFFHQDAIGSPTGSPFSLANVGYQAWSFFVQAPAFMATYPYAKPSFSGVALTWTSPALLLALLARKPVHIVVAMWLAALLAAGPNLLYYVNGFAQFGMRHALDFEPFLFVLIVLGVRRKFPLWGYVLIVISIGVSTWGCWYWNAFYRIGN
jgi:hypothetical protein